MGRRRNTEMSIEDQKKRKKTVEEVLKETTGAVGRKGGNKITNSSVRKQWSSHHPAVPCD